MPQVIHALQEVGFTVYFVHSNGQGPCSASQQLGKNYSHNLLFISAMHPFKIRGRFLFCKDQVRTQSDSGGRLGQSSRPPEWFSWCISGTSHIPLIPSFLQAPADPPGSSQETSWEARSSTWASQAQLGSGAFILLLH